MKFKLETEFQETEIGKIPKEWKIVKLKDIVEPRKEIVDPTQVDPSTPYVGLEHVDSGSIKLERYGKAGDVKSAKLRFYKDDILYGKLRPYLDKAVIAHFDGVCSTDFIVMKTRHSVKPEYLIWVLHTNEFIKYATQTMKGTNHPRTSWESLANYTLCLPPINEQAKIAEILSSIDRAIEVVDAGVVRLEGLKKALMRELLTGRIRVREENGKPVFYRETEFQDTEIGKIPKEWKIVKLGAISNFARRGKTPKYGNSNLLVIKTAHNYPDGIKFEEAPRASEEFLAKLPRELYLKPGDILINSTGTGSVGRVGYFEGYHTPCTVDGHITIFRTNQNLAIPKYVFYYLSSPYGQSALLSKASGSTHQVELYVNEILDLALPLPSLEEQQRIVEFFSMIDQANELYRKEKTMLDRLKRGLMDLLLTGRVRVVE